MKIIHQYAEMKREVALLRSQDKTIGFVPTMGAIHAGHISLVEQSASVSDVTIVSIFVNPTQFNNQEDFLKYPRIVEEDSLKLFASSCDILFLPSVADMYDNPDLITEPIDLGYLDTILEGAMRPGHYQGVVTIVEKLIRTVEPSNVFMGLKDYQQVKVVEYLVKTKELPTQIVGCHTLREPNGLAMSSRNMRLSEEGRSEAALIYQILQGIQENSMNHTVDQILTEAKMMMSAHPQFSLEYIEIRDATDLSEVSDVLTNDHSYVALIACWLEGVRLIDNVEF